MANLFAEIHNLIANLVAIYKELRDDREEPPLAESGRSIIHAPSKYDLPKSRALLKTFHFSRLPLSDSEMAPNRGFGRAGRARASAQVTRPGWKYDGISMRNELLAP